MKLIIIFVNFQINLLSYKFNTFYMNIKKYQRFCKNARN